MPEWKCCFIPRIKKKGFGSVVYRSLETVSSEAYIIIMRMLHYRETRDGEYFRYH